jgi:hypothetical protein
MESTVVQDLLNETFRQPKRGYAHLSSAALQSARPPYTELGAYDLNGWMSRRDDAIFIIARFRSGSTLLWTLFRHLDLVSPYRWGDRILLKCCSKIWTNS